MKIEAIKELIDADEKTRASIEAENNKKKDLKETIAAEEKAISDKAWTEAKQQVTETKKSLDEKIQISKTQSEDKFKKDSEALQKEYDAHKQEWKQQLFERIVGDIQ